MGILNVLTIFLSAPILPLVDLVQTLLTMEPSFLLFQGIWKVETIVFIAMSMLIFIYAGSILVFKGASPLQRAKAKEMIQNTIVLIIFLQLSFFLYEFLHALVSDINSFLLWKIRPDFFLLTFSNVVNISLEVIIGLFYVVILLCTAINLGLRYIVLSFGVVFLPIGIFLYGVYPLRRYGKVILHFLGGLTFVSTLQLLIIFCTSVLLENSFFPYVWIIIVLCCLVLCNLLLYKVWSLARSSGSSSLKEDVALALKYLILK